MKHAHIYLVAILLLHAGGAALWQVWFWNYVPDGGPEGDWMLSPAIYWIPLFSLLYVWCRVDAETRNVQFPFSASILVSLFFPIGVPFYFFKTYSRRDALIHTGLFLIFVVACFAAGWLGGKVTHQYYAVWTNK